MEGLKKRREHTGVAQRNNSQGWDDRGKKLGFSDMRSSEERHRLAGVDASGAGRRGLRSWSPDSAKGSIWLELDPQEGGVLSDLS